MAGDRRHFLYPGGLHALHRSLRVNAKSARYGRKAGLISRTSDIELTLLNPEHFLNLADCLLDFPAYLFTLAFGFQVGIVRHSSDFFLNFAFHFVKFAFGFVLRALPHGLFLLYRDLTGVSRQPAVLR
jgi:hypothetical protein